MSMISESNKICADICKSLGLKNVIRLNIYMSVDRIVTVEAELYPDESGMKDLPALLKKFELKPIYEKVIKPNRLIEDMTTLGDTIKSYKMNNSLRMRIKSRICSIYQSLATNHQPGAKRHG